MKIPKSEYLPEYDSALLIWWEMWNNYAKKSEKMIRNKKDWSDIIFTMGKAAHFIQDLNSPHHGIGRYIAGKHEKFEEYATRGYWAEEKFDGFQYIVNYKNFAFNAARFSKRYIKFENKIVDYEYNKKIMEPLYDHTTNKSQVDTSMFILHTGILGQTAGSIAKC